MKPLPNASGISAWLSQEGIVETTADFPPDGDLFAVGLDSMAVMQLVVAAEDTFGIVLGPHDLTRENLHTPTSLASLFSRKSLNA